MGQGVKFAARLLGELEETPKLLRSSGEVEVERSAVFRGVSYDPGLVGKTDLEVFARHAENSRREGRHLTALIRAAEKHRAHPSFPEHIHNHISSVGTETQIDQLERLEPGSRPFMRILHRFRCAKPEEFAKSKWHDWYMNSRDDEAEARRAFERLRGAKRREKARREKERKERERAKWKAKVEARRKRERKFKVSEMITLRNGRWISVFDEERNEFITKANALKWSRHLVANPENPDYAVLEQVLDEDRRPRGGWK